MAGGQKVLTLDQLTVGKRAVIKTVGGEGALRRRLLDLGLTPYTPVMVRRIAPLGDPIELYIRGYELTLRKSEAKAIEVFYFECSHFLFYFLSGHVVSFAPLIGTVYS